MNKKHSIATLLMVLSVFVPLYASDFNKGYEALIADNYDLSLEYLLPLAEEGNALARYNVGVIYARLADQVGNDADAKNLQAAKWFLLSALQGLPEAQHKIGLMHYSGIGTTVNQTEGKRWFKSAAELGLAESQYALAMLAILDENFEEAAQWLQLASDQDYLDSTLLLANLYRTGNGIEKNHSKAVDLYKLKAEQGHPEALYYLGLAYGAGLGIEQDFTQAYVWLSLASHYGHEDAARYKTSLENTRPKSEITYGRELATEIIKNNIFE